MSRQVWVGSFAKQAGRNFHFAAELAGKIYALGLQEGVELLAPRAVIYSYASENLSVPSIAQRGWDRETSVLMFKNFRLAYPQMRFDPELHRVMSRQQLIDEYGLFGDVMDDIARRPGSQVYFERLLSGNVDLAVSRPVIAVNVLVGGEFASHLADAVVTVQMHGEDSKRFGQYLPVSQGEVLSYATASTIYKKATGLEFEATGDLHPLWNDYDELAKAGIDVRPPEG